jgi:hypothetical protein
MWVSDVISIETFLSFHIANAGDGDKHVMFSHLCKCYLKAGLHCGNYCSKLVNFEAQKKISMTKSPSLKQFLPERKNHLKVCLQVRINHLLTHFQHSTSPQISSSSIIANLLLRLNR